MEFDPDEIISQTLKSLQYNKKDGELLPAISAAIENSLQIKRKNDEASAIRRQYWAIGAKKEELDKIHPKKSKNVNNRIWANLLTVIPYWINRTPLPVPISDKINNKQRERIINALKIAWEVNDDLKGKMQKAVLHWVINHIGWLKMRWNNEKKEIETINVLPEKIGFDPRATKIENCEYIWEQLEEPICDIIQKFPSKKKEILSIANETNKNSKTKLKYIEFWGGGGEWVAWKLGEILLGKKKNPNYDYQRKENNLFAEPKFPYLPLNCFNLGYSLYDDTGIIDQAINLQDAANKTERKILNLIDGMQRVWIGQRGVISKQDLQKIVQLTGDFGVYADTAKGEGIRLYLAGKPDAAMFNEVSRLLSEIDNVMGVHAALRGEYERGMSGIGMKGYGMMIQQDLSKDLIVSKIEQLAENWFNMYLHFLKVYGDEIVSFVGENGTISIDKSDIPQGLKIMVKKGSSLPVDRASRAELSLKLAGLGIAAPADIYDDLGYGDTEKRLENLAEYRQGNIVPSKQTDEGRQLKRVEDIVSSPQFKKLPPEKQFEVVQRAKEIVGKIKGGI